MKLIEYFTIMYIDINFWIENLDHIAKNDPSACPQNCGRKYGGKFRKGNLKLHLTKECGKSASCSLCKKSFKNITYLKHHLETIHNNY